MLIGRCKGNRQHFSLRDNKTILKSTIKMFTGGMRETNAKNGAYVLGVEIQNAADIHEVRKHARRVTLLSNIHGWSRMGIYQKALETCKLNSNKDL